MSNQDHEFFQRYANAINSQRFDEIKACFKLPFILVHKEPKSVVSFDQELERKVKGFLLKLRSEGIVELSYKILKGIDVSSDMRFVAVEWRFINEFGATANQYTNSYILANEDQGQKIITLIVDDKHDFFLQLLK